MSQSLTLRFNNGKFKIESFKILLENLHTQKKTVTTIISHIRNLDKVKITECTNNKENPKIEVNVTPLASSGAKKAFVSELVSEIEDHVSACIYKDKKFLLGKFNYEQYSDF